ncbi:MAG: spermidine synthase [Candidatus Veblenbacteria bacterium]|nr:spermidine synthase [Candidatus Veblenbacteria bacterium]
MFKNAKTKIFLTSGLLLFLELALIRYLPAHISYLGYYSNFILLASFVGMGLGFLLARTHYDLARAFPWLLLATAGGASVFAISISPDSLGEIHFTSNFRGIVIPEFLLVPLIFLLVTATFAALSQRLGWLFTELPPLTAYRWDILGSLTGIALFTLAAYVGLGPVWWFGLVVATFLALTYAPRGTWRGSAAACGLLLIIVALAGWNTRWSPYQKLHLKTILGTNDLLLYANNIGHQRLEPTEELPAIYRSPYELFQTTTPYEHALVIGSGTGNDVAMALAQGVRQVTAVEIDPEILELGRQFHPDRPYNDARVTTEVDDARSFLSRTQDTYDLIIFALPDSVLLASGHGNIRLESFLFTRESFAAAQEHLAPQGLMVLYNYYRQPWLIEKLAGMLQETFGQKPYVINTGTKYHLAVLMIGNKLDDLTSDAPASISFNSAPPVPATDNWPFLYLKKPSLPWTYLIMLGIIGLVIYLAVAAVSGRRITKRLEPTYFFLGVAFLLLETTALVRFSLLFGTTWLVNALVFFAILALVLLAITLAGRLSHRSLPFLYAGLGAILLAQYLVPLPQLLALPDVTKYLAVSLLTLLPVFFANIIFSLTFKSSQENDFNFASNILGAGVGGILEYAALVTGYRHLILVILLCYAVAFFFAQRRLKVTTANTADNTAM